NTGPQVLRQFQIWTTQANSGVTIDVGLNRSNEIQKISFSTNPIGGSMKLKYTKYISGVANIATTDNLIWKGDINDFASQIQNNLNSLSLISNVICTGIIETDGYNFYIEFSGDDGNTRQVLLETVNANFMSNLNIKISKI